MIINKKIAITPMEDTLRFAGIVDFSGVDAPANKSRYDYIRSLITVSYTHLRAHET